MREGTRRATREVTMNVETLEHPIEPQSAIMKGN
jgi:hypothetical protein